jgi:hypothetical protein
MIGAAADADRFEQLRRRREAMRGEITRLQYLARAEAAEAEEAHRAALAERLADCRARAAEVHDEIGAVSHEMSDAVGTIIGAARRVLELSGQVEGHAGVEQRALDALAAEGVAVAEARPRSPQPAWSARWCSTCSLPRARSCGRRGSTRLRPSCWAACRRFD